MPHDPKGQGHANREGKSPKRGPAIVRVLRVLNRQYHYAKRDRKKGETEHQRNERMMARWTRLLGIFTVILALIAGLTAWILEKTDQTLKDTLAASNATNRAFVYFRELIPHQTVEKDENTNWTFLASLENNGNTQTRNVTFSIACEKTAIKMLFKSRPNPETKRVIGPKQIVGSGACTWASSILDQTRQSQTPAYIGAVVEYNDIFGGEHVTKYCREIYILADPKPKASSLEFVAAFCADLPDCADEECSTIQK